MSPTSLTVVAPQASGNQVHVWVMTSYGVSAQTGADLYTYVNPAPPTVSGVTPISGSTRGGTEVTVTGTYFIDVAQVTFGGRPAVIESFTSPTSLTVFAPTHNAGVFDVRVTTAFGTSPPVATDRFTYVQPPAITSVSPNAGWSGGGKQVTVNGANFINVTSVMFGGVAGISVSVTSPTSISVIAPPHAVGPVDVRVATQYGLSPAGAGDVFTYGSLTFTYTDYSIAGADSTRVTGINTSGVVVGYYTDGTGQYGFIDDHGTITHVNGPPGSTGVIVTSINDLGTVTGAYWIGDKEYGFVRDTSGNFTTLDDPNVAPTALTDRWGTVPSQINNAGTVVGFNFITDLDGNQYPDPDNYPNPSGVFVPWTFTHGFVWSSSTGFTPYGAPGDPTGTYPALDTAPYGLNNSGQMVGEQTYTIPSETPPDGEWYLVEAYALGFVTSVPGTGTTFTSIVDQQLGGGWCSETRPQAINDLGTIAGASWNGCAPVYYAWLWRDGEFTFFNYPGATITSPSAITLNGVVAGSWTSSTGQVHGFIARPN